MGSESKQVFSSDEEAVRFIYASYAEDHEVYGKESSADSLGRRKHQEFIVNRFFPPSKKAQVLEIGCGDGRLVETAWKRGYINTYGQDVSSSMIGLARRRALAAGTVPPENFELGDAITCLSGIPPGSLDLIVAVDVLEHLRLHEMLNFLLLSRAALKTGGHVLLHVPNGASPLHGKILNGDVTHHTAFTTHSIQQISRVSGFKSAEIFEDAPVRSGIKSYIRAILWRIIRTAWVVALAVETGQTKGHVLTMNLFAVLVK